MHFYSRIVLSSLLLLGISYVQAQSSLGSPFIHLDQFGYLPDSRKVIVMSNPVQGYNAGQSFSPAASYELRNASTDAVVWTGSPQPWNSGQTHSQSGDQGWWLDFSSITTQGEYYLYDPVDDIRSHNFRIANDVYNEILKQAVRTFYYQRLNFAKQAPYADNRWTEGAVFDGADQDRTARSRWAKTDPATARDVHGGWMDAGDLNKYTTFAHEAVFLLLQAYDSYPTIFGDDYNIPESGNGIPDILDEIIYELDWLKRMQDATGTNGFFLKVGTDNYDYYHPPSTDPRPRYYLPECTSATLAGASMFAKAGVVLRNSGIASLQSYATDLINRSEAAWARAKVTTSNFNTFELNCDDGDIKSGDADQDTLVQMEYAFGAAVYLYDATNKVEYKTYIEAEYDSIPPMLNNWWGPYSMPTINALLHCTQFGDLSQSVKTAILNQKSNMNYLASIDDYNAQTDLYLSHMPNAQYHWGSSKIKAHCGNLNFDFYDFDINATDKDLYREIGEQYLHSLHGLNPLGKVMLSNMYDYGADSSVNEIYHAWFDNGTIYDNAITSSNGPAPGYLSGGPNASFSVSTISPPASQPQQKAYKDWNTGWPESSWEISEPAIYYQAGYILLLSRIIGSAPLALPVEDLQFSAKKVKDAVELSWFTEGEIDNDFFVLERSKDAQNWVSVYKVSGAGTTSQAQHYSYTDRSPFYGANYYRLLQQDYDGKKSYSQIIFIEFGDAPQLILAPNPASDVIRVQLLNQNTGVQTMQLVDMTGRILKSYAINRGETMEVVIDHLPRGAYWLRVQQGDGWLVERFVK